jgi:carboxymethylenebutenolidase
MALRDYLATEVALDHVDGHLSRREALRKLGLLGLSAVGASTLLAACAADSGAPPPPAPAASGPPAAAGYDVAAALARVQPVTFPGPAGELRGAFAAAEPAGSAKGAVLVVHENRGLTDHIQAVTGRLAGDGYSALAVDLLSRAGGTAAAPDATAALGQLAEADLVADLQAGVAELGRRVPGAPLAAIGFCFGGGMVWRLLDAGTPQLAAAVPFYGPSPEAPTFEGSRAAVLGVFAERDARVNAGKDKLDAALKAAGLTYELKVVPGTDHAFFNDTGQRYNAAAAQTIYADVLAWFGNNLR